MSTDVLDDRPALVVLLRAALRGDAAARTQLTARAAELGADRANAVQPVATVIADLDAVEDTLLAALTGAAGTAASAESGATAADDLRRAHRLCAAMRRDVLEAYGRSARHDIVNAVGAVRNAMLLIAENTPGVDPQRFRDIAARNLQLAERRVRAHFADDTSEHDDIAVVLRADDRARDASAAGSSAVAGAAGSGRSGGNARNDLGRPGEREHLDAASE